MDDDNLIRMANRIAEFFDAMPDRAEAIDGVGLHLMKFWEPRMRRALVEHVDREGTAGLHPLVAAALVARRDALLRPSRALP